ncbi:MAG: DNA translocase FtsK 4TM domain-containing protein, partial [Pseudomonadota bacterium]
MRSTRLSASNAAANAHLDASVRSSGGVRNGLRSLLGLALFAGLAAIAASLATWSVNDPSVTHATDAQTQNLLGYFGASLSDLLMQCFGLAIIAILVPAGMLAWRLTFAAPLPPMRTRYLSWAAGATFASAALGALPRFDSWPLPNGLGGIIGDGMLQMPAWALGGFPTGVLSLTFFVVFGGFGAAALLYAALLIRSGSPATVVADDFAPNVENVGELDEDYERRPGLLLGLAGHMFLTARYHLHRAWLRFDAWRSARAQALADRRARLEAEEAGLAPQLAADLQGDPHLEAPGYG